VLRFANVPERGEGCAGTVLSTKNGIFGESIRLARFPARLLETQLLGLLRFEAEEFVFGAFGLGCFGVVFAEFLPGGFGQGGLFERL